MRKEDFLSILNEVDGDEHVWIDFKVDYEIGGIVKKKAEFIRDVSSLANSTTERDRHYIAVGVDDDGEIVGIDENREEYRGEGPRHIFSFGEHSIQQTIDSNLAPSPKVEWHKYEENSMKIGVLVIEPLDAPPCVTTQHLNEDDRRWLHKGLIYVRKGSSKKIAGREELQEIIQYRIEQQRQTILDGITKAVQIGPEWIDRLGGALPDDSGIPIRGAEGPEEAEFEVTQRLTRQPASNIDEALNEDIAQWKYRGDDYIEPKPLWQYYSNPNALTLDEVACKFLTQASIKNHVLGGFWLMEAPASERRDILLSGPGSHHRTERAGSALLLLDDEEGFEDLMDASRTNAKFGHLSKCKRKFGNTIQDRVNYVMKEQDEYRLNHDGWRKAISPKELSPENIREVIPELGNNLEDLQKKFDEHPSLGAKLENFRNALWDLEVVYVAKQVGGYSYG